MVDVGFSQTWEGTAWTVTGGGYTLNEFVGDRTICSPGVRALWQESRAMCPSAVHPLLLDEHPETKHILKEGLQEAGIILCHIAR